MQQQSSSTSDKIFPWFRSFNNFLDIMLLLTRKSRNLEFQEINWSQNFENVAVVLYILLVHDLANNYWISVSQLTTYLINDLQEF